MKAFITGITGFVGPHLAAHLLERGDQVAGSSLSGSRGERLATLRHRVPLVAWNLTDGLTDSVRAAVEQFAPDAIYHLAAISVPDECGRDAPTDEAVAVNVGGTRAVMDLAASLDKPPRVLFASSAHVYGAATFERPAVDEHAPLAPRGGYGITKLEGERAVAESIERQGTDAVVARVFKHAGPGQSPPMMLAQWCRQLVESPDAPLRVYSLDSFLDFSDVRDVVRAYRLLIEAGRGGEIYNLGSGVNRRSGDILEALQRAAGVRREVVEERPRRLQEPIADIAKIVAHVGWRPSIPLEQTLRDTFEAWTSAQQ